MYELVKLNHPFSTRSDELLKDKLEEKYDKTKDNRISENFWVLIQLMLKKEEQRPSIDQIIILDFVRNACLIHLEAFDSRDLNYFAYTIQYTKLVCDFLLIQDYLTCIFALSPSLIKLH